MLLTANILWHPASLSHCVTIGMFAFGRSILVMIPIIGLVVNEICMFIGMDVIYANWPWIQGIMSRDFAKDWFFKFGATGVVMVYNFITRKMFIEKKE